MYFRISLEDKMAFADQKTYPVQCQDDPYPSNGVVVSGEMSYPFHRCTSQMAGYWRYVTRVAVIEAENRNADNALGHRYGHGGPPSLERDGPHEEEKNFPLKGEKKKKRKKTKERIPQC